MTQVNGGHQHNNGASSSESTSRRWRYTASDELPDITLIVDNSPASAELIDFFASHAIPHHLIRDGHLLGGARPPAILLMQDGQAVALFEGMSDIHGYFLHRFEFDESSAAH